ncbi:hypothetical protein BCY84_04747 [Trypanosoma cruzi cruzi]|nr:hypothetical protein BCY84_04747 [Trypanosoma cruzi cruzi]
MKRRKGEAVRVRRGSHPLWECCTACGGIALKCRTITHEDVARSGRSFLCLRDVDAAASDLSARWLQCVAVTLFSRRTCCHVFTCVLFRGQCAGGCAVAGWRGVEGITWVQRSRVALGVSPRRAFPTQPSTARVGHPLSLRSVVVDATSTQRGSGCCHRHECDRKGTPQLLRFEGGNPCGTAACPQPPRGLRALHRALAAECLRRGGRCGGVSPSFQVDGRLILLFFPPRRMAAR